MSEQSQAEIVGLFKYGVIAGLLSVPKGAGRIKKEFIILSQKSWLDPGGNLIKLSPKTIEEWYYTFRNFGFPGLMPKKRKDTGFPRALDAAIQEEITRRKKANPKLTTSIIVRQLLEENKLTPGAVSIATIYRFMANSGLKDFTGKTIKERRAFEADFPGELWQSDLMYGPYLSIGKKKYRTYLYFFIDDHSRIIPHAQFYLSESLASLIDCFKQAILKRGIPYKLYTDNGKVYLSHHFNLICAGLGIKLIHCEPFDPQAKGKAERFLRTLRQKWLAALDMGKIISLFDLNYSLWAWLEGHYHVQIHSSIECPPLEKWAKSSNKIRSVPHDLDLDILFLAKITRSVSNDGCVSIKGKKFEVDPSLVAKRVELRYDPFNLDKVLVYFQGKFIQTAIPLDIKLNAKLPRRKEK